MGGVSATEITSALLCRNPSPIQPRVAKSRDAQSERTKKSAEVFTPLRLCAKMNDFLEGEILSSAKRVDRVEDRTAWQGYVDVRILEITCGEAPFIVSRYDAATGETIPVEKRIGILDRKLRLVNENAADEKEWMKWTIRAYESVYGYELQGDSLAIARANLLITFAENMEARWGRKAKTRELTTIANRIVWNFWQMDGLTGNVSIVRNVEVQTLPGFEDCTPKNPPEQLDFFAAPEMQRKPETFLQKKECRIFDWRKRMPVIYNELGKGKTTMKFDFAIGNPPYQEESIGNNASDTPVYHYFYDKSFEIADCVELISPARFLFNAGGTPKEWNAKMLNDPHLKILDYEQRSSNVFAGTSISGGIVVTLRNAKKNYGAIEVFSPFKELNSIVRKVNSVSNSNLSSIVSNRGSYRYSDLAYDQYPQEMKQTADRRIAPSAFERMPELFLEKKPTDGNKYVKILGVLKGKRVYRWFKKDLLAPVRTLGKFKVFISKADGAAGQIGLPVPARICGKPNVEGPGVGSTETFISIGIVDTKEEAEAIAKYVRTKFSRAMLGVLKVTQNCASPTWRKVPLQDFTSKSDIDWSKSVKEIDQQLYRKYKLSKAEIKFIETHVKEME